MPRPNLIVTATITKNDICSIDHICAGCQIQITNTGNTIANNPVAVCQIYAISNNTITLVGSTQVAFGPVAPTQSFTKTTDQSVTYGRFSSTNKEVAVVVFDNDKYAPSLQTELNLEVPGSFIGKITDGLVSYCSSNPDTCAKAIGTFVGPLIKSVIG